MRHIVITGGNRGLGLAQTKHFLSLGDHVHVVSRSKGELDTLPQDRVSHYPADLANWRDTSWLDGIHGKTGRIDGLVNNSGVNLKKPVWETTADELELIMNINVNAMFMASGHYIRLEKENGGAIVNISSMGGLMALRTAAAYVTSKTAVIGLTRCLAGDARALGFRCNAVCPGFIETNMTRTAFKSDPARYEQIAGRIPSHALGTPAQIATAVAWLMSDAANYVNGVALPVDDGYSVAT